jgi:hypothetical protein
MGMEDGASSREQEILADLPVVGIWVKGHDPSNDFNGDEERFLINVRGELIEMEEMLLAEDDHTAISPNGAEIRETHRATDGDPSFRNDLFGELGGL